MVTCANAVSNRRWNSARVTGALAAPEDDGSKGSHALAFDKHAPRAQHGRASEVCNKVIDRMLKGSQSSSEVASVGAHGDWIQLNVPSRRRQREKTRLPEDSTKHCTRPVYGGG